MNGSFFTKTCFFDPSLHPPYLKYLTYTVVPLFILISCYTNMSTIMVIRSSKKPWQNFNVMTVNSSVCNLFLTIVPPTLFTAQMLEERWMLGEHLCTASVGMQYTFLTAHCSFMALMAYERFQAIDKPLANHQKKRKVLIWMSLFIYGMSAILAFIGSVFINPNIVFKTGRSGCINTWMLLPSTRVNVNISMAFIFIYFLVLFLLPSLCLVITYTKLAFKLRSRSKKPGLAHNRRNKKITRMLVATVLLFEICWLPCWVSQFTLTHADIEYEIGALIDSVVNAFCYCHAVIGPLIFPVFLQEYRSFYGKQFACVKKNSLKSRELNEVRLYRKFSIPTSAIRVRPKLAPLLRANTDSTLLGL